MAASSVLIMPKTTELVVLHEEVAAVAMAVEADILEEAIRAVVATDRDRIHSHTVVADTQLSTAIRSRNNLQLKVRTCFREEEVVTPMDRKVKVLNSDETNT